MYPKLFDLLIDKKLSDWSVGADPVPPLNQQAVMMSIYGRIDDALGPTLRTLKAGLRARLEKFAVDHGQRPPMSVRVAKETWDLDIIEQAPAMKRFWEPYFEKCDSVTIGYAENVFFRGGHKFRAFVRQMDVNDCGPDGFAAIQEHFPMAPEWYAPSGCGGMFVSAGDCAALVHLVQQFERYGLQTTVIKGSHLETYWPPRDRNGLILLGSSRSLKWISERFEGEKFRYRVGAHRLIETGIHDSDQPDDEPSLPALVKGVISRTMSDDLGCCLTMIASNHGRFEEAVAKYLTSERELPALFEAEGWDPLLPVPKRFQILADVPVVQNEDIKKRLGRDGPVILKPRP